MKIKHRITYYSVDMRLFEVKKGKKPIVSSLFFPLYFISKVKQIYSPKIKDCNRIEMFHFDFLRSNSQSVCVKAEY